MPIHADTVEEAIAVRLGMLMAENIAMGIEIARLRVAQPAATQQDAPPAAEQPAYPTIPLDQRTAHALTEAGEMTAEHYIELVRKHGWTPDPALDPA